MRLMTPLILTITGLPAALVTPTVMTRLSLVAVARGTGAAVTVMVKVRDAAVKAVVATWVAVIVAVPAAIAEIDDPLIAAIAGLLDV